MVLRMKIKHESDGMGYLTKTDLAIATAGYSSLLAAETDAELSHAPFLKEPH